jgi:quercetin dioxygenase-like cupin family protein
MFGFLTRFHTPSLQHPAHRTIAGFVLLSLAAIGFAASCGERKSALDPTDIPSGSGANPVVREILAAMDDPPGAGERRLTLVRYTIAAGATLAAHIHPGVQMASIESGTLSYQVVSGRATVRRAGSSVDEYLDGPVETTLGPGDAVIEPFDMVHYGANTTAEPVVILATLLTEAGQDLAVPVSTP